MSKSGQSVIIIGSFSNRVLTACFSGRSECARVGGVRKAVMISVTSVGNFVPRDFTFCHILMEKAWGRALSDLRILRPCWHYTGMVEHLSDMWLCFRDRRRWVSSRRHSGSFVLTGALSRMIFVVAQKLSGIAVADLGEGPVRPAPPYFEPKQTEARRAQKILETAFHHSPPPPTPYLKVWLRHCIVST